MKTESIMAIAATILIVLAIMATYGFTIRDIMIGGVLAVWVLFVVFYLSKIVAKYTNKYVSRKFIHFTTAGLVTLLIYFTLLQGDLIFSSPTIPVGAAFVLALITFVPHIEEKELTWFQVKNNFGEVWFCISWGILFLVFWYVDLIIPVIATFFMAFGDGVTGIVRNYVYKKWTKGLWGSVAMLAISAPFGAFVAGVQGFLSAVLATIVEKMPWIDDNLTVPLVSAVILYLLRYVVIF